MVTTPLTFSIVVFKDLIFFWSLTLLDLLVVLPTPTALDPVPPGPRTRSDGPTGPRELGPLLNDDDPVAYKFDSLSWLRGAAAGPRDDVGWGVGRLHELRLENGTSSSVAGAWETGCEGCCAAIASPLPGAGVTTPRIAASEKCRKMPTVQRTAAPQKK